VLVRAPLLPVHLCRQMSAENGHSGTGGDRALPFAPMADSLLPLDMRLQVALAVGSNDLFEALERTSPSARQATRLRRKVARFLTRMATRPTPYGLFAGVALAHWGSHTDLALAAGRPPTRTRPDMAWLLQFVLRLEARDEVRRHLRFYANPAATYQADRVFLPELAPRIDGGRSAPVSIRATGVVKGALAFARDPVPYEELVAELLTTTPEATEAKIEHLLTELWRYTLLLTDLRPPLTTESPVHYVLQRLASIPPAADACAELQAVVDATTAWDTLPLEQSLAAYRRLAAQMTAVSPHATQSAVQVDMALVLKGRQLHHAVGAEVARLAELLVRLSPLPNGLPYLATYRRAFEARYGRERKVPLLEVLDPDLGLGSPYRLQQVGASGQPSGTNVRAQTLLSLACGALRDGQRAVELDEQTVRRLATSSPTPESAPPSLDIYAFVAASSAAALDAGNFTVVIGPNLGAAAAGRNLGRFSDLLGDEARAALEHAARAEELQAPTQVWAELVYLPDHFRSANVLVRPAIRSHEIAVGVSAGVPHSRLIRLNELTLGIRDGRFCLYWSRTGAEVVVCSGHMLNYRNAPVAYRFLADINSDTRARFNGFDWGPAVSFPFLPRVQSGRCVLYPARWRIDTAMAREELSCALPERFPEALALWRARWCVPRYTYLSTADQRLLLDLEAPTQAEDLRGALLGLGPAHHVILQEMIPSFDQIWTEGPGGRFLTEIVVSLVQRGLPHASVPEGTTSRELRTEIQTPMEPVSPRSTVRLCPPGSEWLFAKLYCRRAIEEDLIAGPVRCFAEEQLRKGAVSDWFFLRYADPDPHIRLRFQGDPHRLTAEVLPALCTWGTELHAKGLLSRFAIDSYDREVERYGGLAGVALAEQVFAADSHACADLLGLLGERAVLMERVVLVVVSVDDLLAGLGFDAAERTQWCADQQAAWQQAGPAYRRLNGELRNLLGNPSYLSSLPGGTAIVDVLATRRERLAPVALRFAALVRYGALSQSASNLYASYIHLHCNRLLGTDRFNEAVVIGLLARTRAGLLCAAVGSRKGRQYAREKR
jgi:thiopeptide-type bacteriocin biosynthesis protein